MRFVITRGTDDGTVRWEAQGSPPDYPVLADSPGNFPDEKSARSSIAKARKAFVGGARMAKVVVDDGTE